MTPRVAHRLVVAAVVFSALAWVVAATGDLSEAVNPYIIPNTAFFVTGALVVWRRPDHPIGWLLLSFGPLEAIGAAMLSLATAATATVAAWLQAVSAATQTVATLFIPLLMLLFPDGRLPSPRWRPVLAVELALLVVLPIAALLTGNILAGTDATTVGPLGPSGTRIGAVLGQVVYLMPLVLIAGVVGLFSRYRRADGIERQQLKVLLAAGIAFLVAAITMPFTPLTAEGSMGDLIIAGCLVVLPVATGVALLRYRLWDVDLVLSRGVVVVLLAALVTAVYAVVVLGIGRMVQRGTDDLVLQVVATALVAVAFAPAREQANKVANRLVFGRRATPFEVLAEVTDRMAGSVADDEVLDRVAALLAAGTGASTATVWLRTDGELQVAAAWPAGRDVSAPVALEGDRLPPLPDAEVAEAVFDSGELVGALTLTTSRAEGLTPAERRVLDDMVASVALLLRRVRLDAALAARIDELRASRQRLVTAQDAARRHLERDLHDGAQQQLVAVKVRLGIAKSLAAKEGDEALVERLDALVAQTDEAVDELRAIAHGIYPPLLAAEGLPAAFKALARRQPVPVEVDAEDVGRHPEQVEAAAYFALAHVLEQAVAQTATEVGVMLREADRQLELCVTGVRAETAPLLDRIDAAGGAITQDDDTVTVRLPAGVPA